MEVQALDKDILTWASNTTERSGAERGKKLC